MADDDDDGCVTECVFARELPASVIAAAQAAPSMTDEPMSEFWQSKYEKDAKRHWDMFYKHNQRNAYKDRHWLEREFEEARVDGVRRVVLEVGCGVGNTLFPLAAANPLLTVYGVDLSTKAIELLNADPKLDPTRMAAFAMDLTRDPWPAGLPVGAVDCITCLYVMSAILPAHFPVVAARLFEALRPGARVLFRDYGRYDLAQLRFKPGHRLGENLFVRQNGTRSYYFALDELERLFGDAGFEIEQNDYVLREGLNRKTGAVLRRVWVQCKFRKPVDAAATTTAAAAASASVPEPAPLLA